MDKPEQLFCYSCKNSLGWATDPASIFKCKCGLVLRRGAGDNTVKAEAEFIDLVNQLNKVEDAMRMELSNLKESISGGRGMPPAMVAPTDSTAYLPISVIFLFFLVSSFVCIYFRYYLIGFLLAVTGFILTRYFHKQLVAKAEEWNRVSIYYEEIINDLKSKIYRF